MNNHVSQWLNAYHDGELRPRRQALVEAHLEQCPQCQAELAELEELSALLTTQSLPELRTTPEEFTAQVALRLPRQVDRRQNGTNFKLRWLWYAVPVALLVAIAFLRTVATVTEVLNVIERVGINPNVVSWLAPAPQTNLGLLQNLASRVLFWNIPFNSPLAYSVILPAVFAVCYLIWLLAWWVDHNQSEENINGEHIRQ